jgi:hypothetical protein
LNKGVDEVYWQEESPVYLLVLILNENLIVLIHKNPDFSKNPKKRPNCLNLPYYDISLNGNNIGIKTIDIEKIHCIRYTFSGSEFEWEIPLGLEISKF